MGSNCLGAFEKGCRGQHPVIRDRHRDLDHECRREQGGTKTVGVPEYKMVVVNEPDPNSE